MNQTRLFPILLLSIGLLLCKACIETATPEDNSSVVVEAYLYKGQPVTNVRISESISFFSPDTASIWINNAIVIISNSVSDFVLTPSPGDSGYYHYAGSDLHLEVGDTWSLEVLSGNTEIYSETQVPAPPVGLEANASVLEIPPIYEITDLFNRTLEDLEITWDNPGQSYHYVVIENIENDPDPIDVNGVLEELAADRGRNFRFISEPVQNDNFRVRALTLSQYGTYRVVLFRVNQEYVDLYESGEQDSRSLSEPLTNIVNGYGIFSAFNSDTLHFRVTK